MQVFLQGRVRNDSRPVVVVPQQPGEGTGWGALLPGLKSQTVPGQSEWPKEPAGFLLNLLYAEVSSRLYPKPHLFSLLAPSFSLCGYKLDLINYLLIK